MAVFEIAVQNTILWEGGYSNNKADSGGETYRGISRNNWPNWEGWRIIDSAKYHASLSVPFDFSLSQNTLLQTSVLSFYRQNFWKYDALNSQPVANKIFDLAVNVGQVHAHKIAQHSVNVISPGTHLQEDGILGPASIAAINVLGDALLSQIKQSAIQYHALIAESHPQDAQFLAGWIRRDNS